jgi:hypothetical protein
MKREVVNQLIVAAVFTLFGFFLAEAFIGYLKRKMNILDDIDVRLGQIIDSLRMFNDSLMKEFSSLHENIARLPTRAALTGLLPHADNFAQSYVFFISDEFGDEVDGVKMITQCEKSGHLGTNLRFCDREPNFFPRTSKYYFNEHFNFSEQNSATSSV